LEHATEWPFGKPGQKALLFHPSGEAQPRCIQVAPAEMMQQETHVSTAYPGGRATAVAIKSYHFGARRHRKHALTAAAAQPGPGPGRFSSRRASGWHAHSSTICLEIKIEREGRG